MCHICKTKANFGIEFRTEPMQTQKNDQQEETEETEPNISIKKVS